MSYREWGRRKEQEEALGSEVGIGEYSAHDLKRAILTLKYSGHTVSRFGEVGIEFDSHSEK